jgi:hypothetical protein
LLLKAIIEVNHQQVLQVGQEADELVGFAWGVVLRAQFQPYALPNCLSYGRVSIRGVFPLLCRSDGVVGSVCDRIGGRIGVVVAAGVDGSGGRAQP